MILFRLTVNPPSESGPTDYIGQAVSVEIFRACVLAVCPVHHRQEVQDEKPVEVTGIIII